jgi:hypothetical protein
MPSNATERREITATPLTLPICVIDDDASIRRSIERLLVRERISRTGPSLRPKRSSPRVLVLRLAA